MRRAFLSWMRIESFVSEEKSIGFFLSGRNYCLRLRENCRENQPFLLLYDSCKTLPEEHFLGILPW